MVKQLGKESPFEQTGFSPDVQGDVRVFMFQNQATLFTSSLKLQLIQYAPSLPFLGRQCDPIKEPMVQETGSEFCLPGSKHSTGESSQEYKHTVLPPTTLPSCPTMHSNILQESLDITHSTALLRDPHYQWCISTHLFTCLLLPCCSLVMRHGQKTNLQAEVTMAHE